MGDIRFAFRALRRTPGFFVGAGLILALGIGLSTATFAVFYTVLLRPLPLVRQDRLAILVGEMPGSRTQILPASRRVLYQYQRETRTLSGVAGVGYDGPWTWYVHDPSDPRQAIILRASVVTGNFFDVLGVKPELGRTLRPSDDDLGAQKVMVISHELWSRTYGQDPRILGKQVADRTTGATYTIVGVMPEGLSFERGADIWRPLNAQFPIRADSDLDSPFGAVRVVGRLAPGASFEAAREEFGRLLQRDMAAHTPALAPRVRGIARPLTDEVLGDVRPALRIIVAAVALLLFITCINVANLMLIRAGGRTSELAVRASLGASRGRIVRQLVTEGLVLAVFGGVGGIMIAGAALRALVALAPPQLPRITEARLDAPMLVAGILISSATVLLFALGPALSVASGDLLTFVRNGARSVTTSRRNRRGRQALVVVQFALALVVLAGAGLLARSLERLQRLDLGFDAQRLAAIELGLSDETRWTPVMINELIDRLRARLAPLPGVVSVAAAIQTPFINGGIDGWVSAEGESAAQHAGDPYVDLEFVTANYFTTLGVRMRAGRSFDERDASSTVPAIVVSQSVAEHYWPGQNAVGKRLHCFGGDELCPVIGVAEDTHYRDLVNPHLAVYRVSRQAPIPVFAPRVLLVRTRDDPATTIASLRAAVISSEPAVTIGRATVVRYLLGAPLAQPRLNTVLVAVFAVVALVLACMGIFGVLAYHVSQRTREIGIRQALGAAPRELALMMLREGLALEAAGVVIGVVVSLFALRSVRALLFGVTPTDPVALAAAVGVLLVCGLIGAVIPARHAASVDPSVALRAD